VGIGTRDFVAELGLRQTLGSGTLHKGPEDNRTGHFARDDFRILQLSPFKHHMHFTQNEKG
jgi:hypothetical protein